MATNATIVRQTLALCNRIRAQFNMKPLKKMPIGEMQSADSCPFARAINHDMEVDGYIVHGGSDTIKKASKAKGVRVTHVYRSGEYAEMSLPRYAVEFIGLFDDAQLPEFLTPERRKALKEPEERYG